MASSPARGTWIEMLKDTQPDVAFTVVPRKGDVDRNFDGLRVFRVCHVVPRKGDVDRNSDPDVMVLFGLRRPPQGGRG